MKTLALISLISIILFSACNNSQQVATSTKKKCEAAKLEDQKAQLIQFSDLVITKTPVLETITDVDPITVDTALRESLDSFFLDFCPELLDTRAFERFALLYWYSVKYHQYLCCVPAESQVIPASFLDRTPEGCSDITLHFLLQKNKVTKAAISNNGFTQSSLYFRESRQAFEDEAQVNAFVLKVDSVQKQAYEKAALKE